MIDPALAEAVERACARIAPTWPLDRFGTLDFHHEDFAGVPAPSEEEPAP